jgi:hypothetical protein
MRCRCHVRSAADAMQAQLRAWYARFKRRYASSAQQQLGRVWSRPSPALAALAREHGVRVDRAEMVAYLQQGEAHSVSVEQLGSYLAGQPAPAAAPAAPLAAHPAGNRDAEASAAECSKIQAESAELREVVKSLLVRSIVQAQRIEALEQRQAA